MSVLSKTSKPMLVNLAPDVVSRNWDTFSYYIAQNLPPTGVDGSLDRMYTAIMRRRANLWTLVRQTDENVSLLGVIVTTPVEDAIVGTRSLELYSVFGVKNITLDDWKQAYETLKDHAKELGCNVILGYTAVPVLCKVAKALGGKADVRVIELEVDDVQV